MSAFAKQDEVFEMSKMHFQTQSTKQPGTGDTLMMTTQVVPDFVPCTRTIDNQLFMDETPLSSVEHKGEDEAPRAPETKTDPGGWEEQLHADNAGQRSTTPRRLP